MFLRVWTVITSRELFLEFQHLVVSTRFFVHESIVSSYIFVPANVTDAASGNALCFLIHIREVVTFLDS